MPDNGIKFLARGGLKLDDAVESARSSSASTRTGSGPLGGDVGRVDAVRRRAVDEYVDHLVAPSTARSTGIKVVLDCAARARRPRPARARCAPPAPT